MECKCETEEIFLKEEILDEGILGWQQLPITIDKIYYEDMGVLIDKRDTNTYLRLVNTSDYNCLDSGSKIEISYCPFCGKKLKQM